MGETLLKRVADQGSPPHPRSGAVGGLAIPTVFVGVSSYDYPMHEQMEGQRMGTGLPGDYQSGVGGARGTGRDTKCSCRSRKWATLIMLQMFLTLHVKPSWKARCLGTGTGAGLGSIRRNWRVQRPRRQAGSPGSGVRGVRGLNLFGFKPGGGVDRPAGVLLGGGQHPHAHPGRPPLATWQAAVHDPPQPSAVLCSPSNHGFLRGVVPGPGRPPHWGGGGRAWLRPRVGPDAKRHRLHHGVVPNPSLPSPWAPGIGAPLFGALHHNSGLRSLVTGGGQGWLPTRASGLMVRSAQDPLLQRRPPYAGVGRGRPRRCLGPGGHGFWPAALPASALAFAASLAFIRLSISHSLSVFLPPHAF